MDLLEECHKVSFPLLRRQIQKINEYEKQEIENKKNNPTIIKTDEGAKDGQNKCPKCGATEISLNIKTGKLRCHFCRYEFSPEKIDGLEVGSIIYDYDENGNIIERVVESSDNEYKLDLMSDEVSTYDLISIDENGNETIIEKYEKLEDSKTKYNEIILENPTINYAIKNNNKKLFSEVLCASYDNSMPFAFWTCYALLGKLCNCIL